MASNPIQYTASLRERTRGRNMLRPFRPTQASSTPFPDNLIGQMKHNSILYTRILWLDIWSMWIIEFVYMITGWWRSTILNESVFYCIKVMVRLRNIIHLWNITQILYWRCTCNGGVKWFYGRFICGSKS